MSTEIKNGKHHTINIYILILFFICCFSLVFYSFSTGVKTNGKWVIVIDPGHGGADPGALGSFSREKDINLAIALKTGAYIEENLKNVSVIYTRKNDTKVDLIERPRIANRNNADLFISIHTNWAKSKSVMGAETYIMGLTKDEENLAVAMKENEVMLLEDDYSTNYQGFDPKSPESYIIFTLTQNAYQKQSTELAARIQSQFTEKVNRKDRGVKQAGFWVLFNTTMPGVLIETGFITNPAEEKFLTSKQGQEYIASAIYRAIRDYMNDIELKSGIKVQEPVAPERKQVPTVSSASSTAPTAPTAAASTSDLSPGTRNTAGNIIFRIQVGTASARTEIKPEKFKGITDIHEIQSGNRYRYTTGAFSEYIDAVAYRKKIEKLYPDAFVIAVRDNKILPLQQALDTSGIGTEEKK